MLFYCDVLCFPTHNPAVLSLEATLLSMLFNSFSTLQPHPVRTPKNQSESMKCEPRLAFPKLSGTMKYASLSAHSAPCAFVYPAVEPMCFYPRPKEYRRGLGCLVIARSLRGVSFASWLDCPQAAQIWPIISHWLPMVLWPLTKGP